MDPVREHCRMPGAGHRVGSCELYPGCKAKGGCEYERITAEFIKVPQGTAHLLPDGTTIQPGGVIGPFDTAAEAQAAGRKAAASLPSDSAARKDSPLCTGVLDYFPLALAAVARLSKKGNDKHNPGQPLHWARGKSMDHPDCIMRHLADRGLIDPETGESHSVMVAWRALALLQEEEEARLGLPPSRGSRTAE